MRPTRHIAPAGHALYTERFLRVYDLLLYRVNSPLLWHCSLSRMLALYDEHVSARHLDVGVGVGILLDRCRFPSTQPESS